MIETWRTTLDLEGRPGPPVPGTCTAPAADRRTLRRWSAAVGPVRAGNAAPAFKPDWPLTVAAWNVNVGGGAVHAFWDRLAGHEGAAARPVVVLLQEVFQTGPALPPLAPDAAWASRIDGTPPGNEPRTDIVSFAREAGLSLLYVPSMRNGGADGGPPEDRGNAILANVPLSSPRAIELPFERQRRVAVAATVTTAEGAIAFCSCHLDNRSPWRYMWHTLGSARERQMAGLLGAFPEAVAADAFVLGGDFNTWVRGRREGACKLARKQFPHPEKLDLRPTHHFEIGGWLRHSDHLMFRLPPGWHGEYRRLDDTFGSDHYPLVGTVGPTPGSQP